ncbi:tripartite tricarboxylate transporter TctB family protein [Cryobacterium cryoconiti]|uniref:Uncharacterized protein n=1 Tax=Cryobacterium cryoconiti TaxID=1259239 RepID=A0A4Y8JUD1_9MICO|nr:tripartite tricarboxylate transporter TctB family protein [Cryobacterium cryoconiti]TFD30540.1 hypothetical protein E3T49_07865 [Cryobacterium cryoconiti]
MSDNTPNDGNINPETDAAATTPGRHETGPVDYDSAAEPDAAETRTYQAAPVEPVGEPISYDAPEASAPAPVTHDPSRASATPAYVPAASVNNTAETQRLEPVATPAAETHATEAHATEARATENHAPETPAYAPTNTSVQPPIYIQAPTAPRYKSNRGPGVVIALLSTVIFAAVYAVVAFVLSGIGSLSIADTAAKFTDFIVLPIFYVPVIFFFVAFALLVLIVNRGGWWAYVLFGFLVAVAVYFSYIGAALLSVQAWNFTPDQAARFISQQWLNPGAIAAAVVAREVPIWAGAWIARNGRAITARNETAKAEYDRVLAAGPQGIRSN